MDLANHLFMEAAAASRVQAEAMGIVIQSGDTRVNVPHGTLDAHNRKRLEAVVASCESVANAVYGAARPTEVQLREMLVKLSVARTMVECVLDSHFYKEGQ